MYKLVNGNIHPFKVISEDETTYTVVQGRVSVFDKVDMIENIEDMVTALYMDKLNNNNKLPANQRDGLKEIVINKLKKSHPDLFI